MRHHQSTTTDGRIREHITQNFAWVANAAAKFPLSFDITVTSARIDILENDRPSTSAVANAKRSLKSALAIARKHGYLE